MKTIRELADDLAAERITSCALIDLALERIDAYRAAGGKAYISVDHEGARRAAQASDRERAAGRVPSLLAGLPVSVKDNIAVRGEVNSAGSVALAHGAPAAHDAPAVARLRAAGAILVGRTNMSEFAFSGLGLNPHYGTPLNPHDTGRIAGGSTAGGAVSVALGMAVAALGTDTGGSVRIPAAFCGIAGFKPSAQRVPQAGVIPLSSTLDCLGALARSVDCCAIVDAILSGQTHVAGPLPLRGLRLGVPGDVVLDGLDEPVRQAFDSALDSLRDAGALVQRFAFPELRDLAAINRAGGFAAAEAWAWHRKADPERAFPYDPRVATRIARGELLSAADYIDLLDARQRLIASTGQRLAGYDAWLMPTVAQAAPRLAPLEQDEALFMRTNAHVLRNASIVNFLDGCALSVPCAPARSGIGLSICGLNGQDGHVLEIGRAVAAKLGTAIFS
ncbi:MAG: amidase [Pseudomonadota bacterium]